MPAKIPDVKYTQIFINNEWRNSLNGKVFPLINPTTASKICDVQEAGQADTQNAIASAKDAFKLGSKWRTMDASQRGRLLYKLADLLERDREYVAALETLNNGKPYLSSLMDLDLIIKTVRYYAGYADKIHGKVIPADGDIISFTRIEPVGVCAMILPWNFPLMMVTHKASPALAAGNTLVIKPSEQTPLTCLYFAQLTKEAGFPPGVVNVVPGFGGPVGGTLSSSMDVDHISFTGSTGVGQMIQQAAGKSNCKRVTLELGGKSPLVIFDDADLDKAVMVAHEAVFYNQGQCCMAGSRTYVQEGIYDEFVARSKAIATKRAVGDPYDPKTQQGPQVNEMQFNKIFEMIDSGKKEGAKLECGGSRFGNKGFFIQPTVFSGVTDNMRIAKEEIFGPVQQIIKFKNMEEIIQRCNDSPFGLASGVYTQDIDKAMTFAQAMQAGVVWINCYLAIGPQTPFGGYKMSGSGRELGEDGINEYVEVKTITMKIPQKNS